VFVCTACLGNAYCFPSPPFPPFRGHSFAGARAYQLAPTPGGPTFLHPFLPLVLSCRYGQQVSASPCPNMGRFLPIHPPVTHASLTLPWFQWKIDAFFLAHFGRRSCVGEAPCYVCGTQFLPSSFGLRTSFSVGCFPCGFCLPGLAKIHPLRSPFLSRQAVVPPLLQIFFFPKTSFHSDPPLIGPQCS